MNELNKFTTTELSELFKQYNCDDVYIIGTGKNNKILKSDRIEYIYSIINKNKSNIEQPVCKKFCKNTGCDSCYYKSVASWIYVDSILNIIKEDLRNIPKSTKKTFDLKCNRCNEIYLNIRIDHHINREQNFCRRCDIDHDKSIASHEKSKYWSPKNKLLPRQVHKNCNEKYIFNCLCGHEISKSPNSISRGEWCGYCSVPVQELCQCATCYNKSLASHEKAEYFSNKNEPVKVYMIPLHSNKKYWFNCFKCYHEFEGIINHITKNDDPVWCPYCSNPTKKLCENDDCIWLKCDLCKQDFDKFAYSKSGCTCTKNKTESKLYNKLIIKYPNIIRQYTAKWCKNKETNRFLPFDFCLPDQKIIIELDGRQHFQQVRNWTTPDLQRSRDLYKMECAKINGYSIIRILQEDVWNDTYDWIEELCYNIDKSKYNDHYIFMCKNNEYKNYM